MWQDGVFILRLLKRNNCPWTGASPGVWSGDAARSVSRTWENCLPSYNSRNGWQEKASSLMWEYRSSLMMMSKGYLKYSIVPACILMQNGSIFLTYWRG